MARDIKEMEHDKATAKLAEQFGASVAWANEPAEFHHLIEFTPPALRSLIAAHQASAPASDIRTWHVQDQARRLGQIEGGDCLSHLVSALARAGAAEDRDLNALMEQAVELCSPVDDWEEAATQEGWLIDGGMFVNHQSHTTAESSPDDENGWREVCEEYGIDPYQREIFEHWIVSDWLADRLAEKGEKVDKDFAGLTVWARTTTGQAIYADGVMEAIAAELNGQV